MDDGSHDFESFRPGSPSHSSFLLAAVLDMLDNPLVAPWTGPVCLSVHLDWLVKHYQELELLRYPACAADLSNILPGIVTAC